MIPRSADHVVPRREKKRFRTVSKDECRRAKDSGATDQLAPIFNDRSGTTDERLRAGRCLRVAVYSRFGELAVEN